jgi:hypothetical protein
MNITTRGAVGIACVATLTFALAVPSAVAASSATGFSGDLAMNYYGSTAYSSALPVQNASSGVQGLEGDTVTSITFMPTNMSTVNYNRQGTVSGSVNILPTTTLAPAEGWAPNATLTFSGDYNISAAFVYAGGYRPDRPNTILSGTGSFEWTIRVSDMLSSFAQSNYPFNVFTYGGPGATAGSGSATFNITRIVASQGMSAVPEASTVSLLALGLLGLGAARRRQPGH